MSGDLHPNRPQKTHFSSQILREGRAKPIGLNPIRTTVNATLAVAVNVCPYPPATNATLAVAVSDGMESRAVQFDTFDTLKKTGL
jgi:hypothetical protein